MPNLNVAEEFTVTQGRKFHARSTVILLTNVQRTTYGKLKNQHPEECEFRLKESSSSIYLAHLVKQLKTTATTRTGAHNNEEVPH